MGTKFYQALLAAALYILVCDICTAIYGAPGAASLELGSAAISQGIVVPE
jgi:hypothetical protein